MDEWMKGSLMNESGWRPRFYYSHYHIQAAALFSRLSARFEQEYKGNDAVPYEVIAEHRAYVTGCILSAGSFLEAGINEIFADAADDKREHIHQMGEEAILLIAHLRRLGVAKTASYPILQKYQIALVLAKKQQFDKGTAHYQNVDLLITLRNALVHFDPETTSQPGTSAGNIEKRLQGKFTLNPLTGSKTPFFPERCMSAGCAKWAVESSVKFADDFCARLGLTPIFDGVRASLIAE
jgi:hypothetical protein